MWLSNNWFPVIEGIDTSLSVCMKRPTGSWNSRCFAGYRPAGQPICLCLQMAGAAAIKGQQNVNRTRPYSDCNHVPVTRGGTHPGGVTHRHFLSGFHPHNTPIMCMHVVRYQGTGPWCSWWPVYPPLPKPKYLLSVEISGCTLPSGSPSSGCVEGCVWSAILHLPSFTHLHPPAVTQPG